MGKLTLRSCVILFAAAFVFFSSIQTTAKVVLTPESSLVAGGSDLLGNKDGYPDMSSITEPCGMCPFGDPKTDNVLAIASFSRFRLLNATNYLATWFGKNPSHGKGNEDGPIDDVYLSNPKGCARFLHTTAPKKGATYYVDGKNVLRWVKDDIVKSQYLNVYDHLVGVAINDYDLFAVSMNCKLFQYTISSENGNLRYRNMFPLEGLHDGDCDGLDIVATNDGIFVSFGNGLHRYASNGTLLNYNHDRPINAVSYDAYTNTLWAATSSAVYSMSLPLLDNTKIRLDLFAGTENASCVYSDIKDGVNPKFCGIHRLYAKNSDQIYLSFKYAVRAVVLPPKVVEIFFPGKPFPINMTGAEKNLDELYDLLDNSVNGKLGTQDVRVNRSEGIVFSNWTTKLRLIIRQREFDDEKTESEIQKMTFPEVISTLAAYYNETNEVVYSDTTLLPVCEPSKMDAIEHTIADHTRKVLNYQLIYVNPFQTASIDASQNITSAKLLMPDSFANQTTRDLLSKVQFSEVLLDAMRGLYPPDHTYTVKFPMAIYHFDRLSVAQEQEARQMILGLLEAQLRACQSQTTRAANEPSPPAPPPAGPSCAPQVRLSNRTFVSWVGASAGVSLFEAFVPADPVYPFSIAKCLTETDWDGLRRWIDHAATPVASPAACGTGCLVGVAIAVAVGVAVVIILIVVCISKRRRLATVVVTKSPNVLNV